MIPSRGNRGGHAFEILLGIYLCFFVVYSCIPAVRSPSNTQVFLGVFSIHSLVGAWLLFRYSGRINSSRLVLWTIFLVSRLAVFPMLPWLSDDVFGYLWHGTLTLNGWNCYVYPANAPEVAYLRNELYGLLAYKTHPAIYPPIAEIFITLGVWLGHLFSSSWQSALFGWKTVLFTAETIGFFLLLRARKHYTLVSPALYLLLPLTAIEICGQAHNDGLVLAPLGAFIFLIAKAYSTVESPYSERKAGFLLGAMTLIKLIPIVMIVPLVLSRISVRRKFFLLLLTGTTVVLIGVIFFYDGRAVSNFVGILKFYNQTQFNSPLLHLVRTILDGLNIPNWWLVAPNILIMLRFVAIIVLGWWFRPLGIRGMMMQLLAVYSAATLISPKVHTWYFIPLLFLNSVVGWRWLSFGASLMMLTYLMYATPFMVEPLVVECVLWSMMIIVALWEFRESYSFRSKI
jgi:hypothetical protein